MLTQISEEKMSEKPAPNKWSKKEIIGHLIDSATNNHHRFVRGQFEAIPEIRHNQNGWNKYSFYQQIDSKQIILFWTIYNSLNNGQSDWASPFKTDRTLDRLTVKCTLLFSYLEPKIALPTRTSVLPSAAAMR